MTLGSGDGAVSVQVEEYKRPKFEVELAAPKQAAKLDAEVVITGKATGYTGAAIGGAEVRWRVVREARLPMWRWPGYVGHGWHAQNIARGAARTTNDGSFTIRFLARPDQAIPKKNEPTFEYHIHVDVTDTNGETRSDERTVRAGYTALEGTLTAGAWQTVDTPVGLTIETRTLDREPQPARGAVKVYRLQQPPRVARADPVHARPWSRQSPFEAGDPKPDPSDPDTWVLDALVAEEAFQTDSTGAARLSIALPAGIYRAILETYDRFGAPVGSHTLVHVLDPTARRFPVKVANHFAAPKWTVEPGEEFVALWGTGYDSGRALVEILHRGEVLRREWTAAGRTQQLIRHRVGEDLRGGFTLRVTYVRENRIYVNERVVDVPWSNKQLTVKWERFRSKLVPGGKETWTASIRGPGAGLAAAEMVAGLYDASLDQYRRHDWRRSFGVFRREDNGTETSFTNSTLRFGHFYGAWERQRRNVEEYYRRVPWEIHTGRHELHVRGGRPASALDDVNLPPAFPRPSGREILALPVESVTEHAALNTGVVVTSNQRPPDLGQVTARRDLAETAFFFPHLLSDSTGVVKMEFTMPEALTEWKFLGFAHDRELRSGFLIDHAVTAKDLMVEPNPPRFVREGDAIEFTVKVTNATAERQTGRLELALADAHSRESRDRALGNTKPEVDFDVPGGESRTYSWRLAVPDGCEFLTYKAVGASARLSDGEENFLPVLSRRVLVTESLPLPIRGKKTEHFRFAKLLESGKSASLWRCRISWSTRTDAASRYSIATTPTRWRVTSRTRIPRSVASSSSGRGRRRSTARSKRTKT
jgi:hypothetical protein